MTRLISFVSLSIFELLLSFVSFILCDNMIYRSILFLGDGDNGSGESSGDDVSGSGDDSEVAHVSDLWHFVPNATYSPLSVPGSAVANQSSMLSSMYAFVICLVVVCLVGMVSKPLAQ